MTQEILGQVRTIRNELDVLLAMLVDAEAEAANGPVGTTAPETPETPEYLSVHDVAHKLGVTSATVYRWASAGLIPAGVQWGPRTRRWRASDFQG